MFPRVSEVKTKGKVYRYLRLVENYRNQNGRKSQRVVCNLGRLEELQKGKLDELTEKLRKFCKKTAAISPARKTNPPQPGRRCRRGRIHRSRSTEPEGGRQVLISSPKPHARQALTASEITDLPRAGLDKKVQPCGDTSRSPRDDKLKIAPPKINHLRQRLPNIG